MVRPHFRQLWIPFLLAMTLLVAACQSGAPAATAPEEKEPAAAAAVTEKSATETEAEVAAQADPDAAPTGADTLRNPEPDFYVIGSKSYGRNSQFLIRVGLEQVLLADRNLFLE